MNRGLYVMILPVVAIELKNSIHWLRNQARTEAERQLQATGRNGRIFRISVSHCSGLSNVMFGESGITMEKTSDFSAADVASVIVNLELTKLTTNDFKFFPLLLGFNNFETLWYHC